MSQIKNQRGYMVSQSKGQLQTSHLQEENDTLLNCDAELSCSYSISLYFYI